MATAADDPSHFTTYFYFTPIDFLVSLLTCSLPSVPQFQHQQMPDDIAVK
jgi:hypothetical protein